MNSALREAIRSTAGHPGPIGVFDSGYGGLTILREIRRALPDADYIYLGDNARAPYGSRSFELVYKFTLEAVEYLFSQGCQLVILACNTASAKALRTIQQNDLPMLDPGRRVLGVIRPTAENVGKLSRNGHVGLFGTPGTVASGSYDLELAKLQPHLRLSSHACPMWVPLVENLEAEGEGADYFVRKDIDALFAADKEIDTVILGCTHYPLLLRKIRQYLPEGTAIVNQGEIVAESLLDYLRRHPGMDCRITRGGTVRYLTTEEPAKFSSLAAVFMGENAESRRITLPNLL
ncbi:MAG: glutamate racemase [Muribaculaceae bacterium]|nr:glutamate racemase [Muribaculaceae bacterium]